MNTLARSIGCLSRAALVVCILIVPTRAEVAPGPLARPSIPDRARAFWSFQRVKRPPVPEVSLAAWRRNPVDAFILARLEAKDLAPGPPTDRRTLIRRATFDLIGLPPTTDQVEAFLADDSPRAFAKVVDRLLASRHYGERWGRHWLDLVRYADTAGDASDFPIPEAYKYRNYVIDAFNRDKPYDEFIREQIAGDLQPYANVPSSASSRRTVCVAWSGKKFRVFAFCTFFIFPLKIS